MRDYEYEPFGKEQDVKTNGYGADYFAAKWKQEVEDNAIDNPFRFGGEYKDNESGNYYLRARYYDPETQRFTQEDTYKGDYKDPISLNAYAFCSNDPINNIDPSGHENAKLTMSTIHKKKPKPKPKPKTEPKPKSIQKPAPKSTTKKDNGNGTVTIKYYSHGQTQTITADKNVNPKAMAQGALRALTDTARVAYADTKANEYAKQNAANSIGSSYCGTKTKSDSATTLGKKTVNIYTTTLANNDKYKNTLNYQAGYFGMSVAMIAGSAALEGGLDDVAKPFTKSSLKLGQEMHKAYKADLVDDITKFKEFSLPSGKRIDYIDFETKTIYELKPYNPRQIKAGTKQLEGYLKEVEEEFGKGWKTVLDTY
ncbi:MAG: RHS repeat-associated core domain-containing protein [Aminipila sp.]